MFLDQSAFLTNGFPGWRERYMIHGLIGWKKKLSIRLPWLYHEHQMNDNNMNQDNPLTALYKHIPIWHFQAHSVVIHSIESWMEIRSQDKLLVSIPYFNQTFTKSANILHLQLQLPACKIQTTNTRYRFTNSSKPTAKVQSRKID